jgi:hypothetical protein
MTDPSAPAQLKPPEAPDIADDSAFPERMRMPDYAYRCMIVMIHGACSLGPCPFLKTGA